MAKKASSKEGYGRWDTFTGTTKGTSKMTATQKKALERVKKAKKK